MMSTAAAVPPARRGLRQREQRAWSRSGIFTRTMCCMVALGAIMCTVFQFRPVHAVINTDSDGEPMWGHVYLEDGGTSYEFFRALFGGVFNCDSEGHLVSMVGASAETGELGEACELDEDQESLEGRVALVRRGSCSFMDKAIVLQQAGAAAVIIANNAPGMIRMPPGVLKQKEGFDVTIPVVMVNEKSGSALQKILTRNAAHRVRIRGEINMKGRTMLAGRCAKVAAEVHADGTVSDGDAKADSAGAPETEVAEGGVMSVEGADKDYEFLRGMFGGPIPLEPTSFIFAEPLNACEPLNNADQARGSIVVAHRGACMFTHKAKHVEEAGAIMIVVVNADSPEINRMWGSENSAQTITIGAVMVSASGGSALSAAPEAKLSFKMTKLRAEQWAQTMKFTKLTDWPENDEERTALHDRLQKLHDPESTFDGHWERYNLIRSSFDQAEEYYQRSTATV